MLPEITLPDRLGSLVRYCEKNCVAECCGIDAFDFSPLHIASFLSAYTGRISDSDLIEWAAELEKAKASIEGLLPD